MKGVKIFTLIAFFAIIAVPLALFNFKSDATSEIDNRKLAEYPFSDKADRSKRWTERTEAYVNDRIGLRDQMILGYTVVNDLAFGKMVHPSYTYGKDGYVFGAGIYTQNDFGEFHIAFADGIKKMQDYCEQRNVPFLLVFNPAKPAILTDKLPSSTNYDRSCIDQFLAELKKRGINYVDNTETLKQLNDSGTEVFNKKYDANHWNDTGAFYGTQNSLKALQKLCPSVHVNDISEFEVGTKTETTLPVSKFPINESVPVYKAKNPARSIASRFTGLPLDKNHAYFDYTMNDLRKKEGAPRVLMFQGSYINSYGHKYYENAFGECIQVHNYQNVLNLPLYYNIFKPQAVVFELAEYTLKSGYFDYNRLKNLSYNPELKSLAGTFEAPKSLEYDAVSIEKNKDARYTTITWKTNDDPQYVWLVLEKEYDMQKTEDGYSVIVPTAEIDKENVKVQIKAYKNNDIYVYS